MASGVTGGLGKWAVVAYVLAVYNGLLALLFFLFHAPAAPRELWPAFLLIGTVSSFFAPLLNDR